MNMASVLNMNIQTSTNVFQPVIGTLKRLFEGQQFCDLWVGVLRRQEESETDDARSRKVHGRIGPKLRNEPIR